jgi:hypothetical protein
MLLDGWSLELPEGISIPKTKGRNIYDESPGGTKKKTKRRRMRWRKNLFRTGDDSLQEVIVDHLQEGIATIRKAIK